MPTSEAPLTPPVSSLGSRLSARSGTRREQLFRPLLRHFRTRSWRPDPFTGYQPTCCKQVSPFTSTSRGWSPRRSSAELLHLTRVPSRANLRRKGALAKRQSLNRSRLVTCPLIEACFQEAARWPGPKGYVLRLSRHGVQSRVTLFQLARPALRPF